LAPGQALSAVLSPPLRRELPRYNLVLHPDNPNDLMFIVRAIMDLLRFCRPEATHKMWETQHYRRSVLLVTWKEPGELYADLFASRGLKVTLEPVRQLPGRAARSRTDARFAALPT